MVPRADRDAFAVDDRAEIVRMDAVDDERQHAGFVRAPCRSRRARGHFGEHAPRRVLEQRVLVRCDGGEIDALEIVDGGAEARRRP